MATWTITPNDASITNDGMATFPKNTGETDNTYTITYVGDDGCSASMTCKVPAASKCQPVTCTCDDLSFDGSQVSFPLSGGTKTKEIASSCGEITVSSNVPWCTATTDGNIITLAASDNSQGSEGRTGTITVKQDGQCNKTFSVYQTYADCVYSNYHLQVETTGLHRLNTSLSFSLDFEINFNTYGIYNVLCSGDDGGMSRLYGTVTTHYADVNESKHLDYKVYFGGSGLPSLTHEFYPYMYELTNDYLNPNGIGDEIDLTNRYLKNNGGEIKFDYSDTRDMTFWWGTGVNGFAHRCEFVVDEEYSSEGNTEIVYRPKDTYRQYNFLSITVYVSYSSRYGFISIALEGLEQLAE